MYPLTLFLIFISGALLAQALTAIVWPKKSVLSDQLKFYETSWQAVHGDIAEMSLSVDAGPVGWVKQALARLVGRGRPVEFLRTRLEMSGLKLEWVEFVYYHLLAVVSLGIAGYLAGGSVVALIVIFGASATPIGVLDYLTSRRRALFETQLPETLTMLSGSLKAGYSLLQAVDMLSKEAMPPMRQEFNKVLGDSRLGLPVEAALDKMGQRVMSTSFDWMILAVKIQHEVGGNLAEVLATLAQTIRDRDTVKRQIKALTAEGRLSALILLCLPVIVVFALYFLNPGYMRLMFTTTAGVSMLVGALALMVVGALWLRRIVRIEV